MVIKFIAGKCKCLLMCRNKKRKDQFISMRHGDGSRCDTLLGLQRNKLLLVRTDSVIIHDVNIHHQKGRVVFLVLQHYCACWKCTGAEWSGELSESRLAYWLFGLNFLS